MKVSNHNSRVFAVLSWAAVLIWMLVIFMLSSQVAEQSDELSLGITEAFIGTVENAVPGYLPDIGWVNHIIRKNAHFLAYLILGFLTSNALKISGVKRSGGFALAFVICVLYAASDEVHQLFVPGRSGKVTDVLIDSAGTIVGITLHRMCRGILRS